MHVALDGIAVLAAMFFMPAVAAEAPAETMSLSLTREVVKKSVTVLESRGLYVRQQAVKSRTRYYPSRWFFRDWLRP